MKKIIKTILALTIAVVTLFAFTACSEVENGSKIQRMDMQIEFLNAENVVVDTQTVQVKLYLNYAPKTTEHFMQLAEAGYYDGVTISHVNEIWCEFGEFTRSNNQLVAKDYDLGTVDGEFAKNGLTGNKIKSSGGVLIMKRNYNTSDGVSQYNSAKATVIMTFTAAAKFSASEYCVFGSIVSDDADETAQSSVSNSVNRTGLSSFDKVQTIAKYVANDAGTRTFYNAKYSTITSDSEYASINSQYFTMTLDESGEKHYFKGTDTSAANEMLDEERELIIDFLSVEEDYIYIIPYTEVRIKSITKTK